jgi:HEAT-like repeat
VKRELRPLLADRRFDVVADLAGDRTRVLGALVPLTFDRDPLIAWRAVEGLGVAAERIAERAPEAVREHVRRLNWLITEESGGICWRAPEAMAEIVARLPDVCAAFVPIVVHLLAETAEEDLQHLRAGMLWAIGRLGPAASAHLAEVLPAMVAALEHPDPHVRGMAVWALSRVGHAHQVAALPGLADDGGSVELYEDGWLTRTTVGALTRRALEPGSLRAAAGNR